MSDPKVEQPDVSGITGSPGQKRKRETESPAAQRTKRTAPPAAMSADTAAFIENAIEATQAATAGGAALGMYPTLHVPASTEEQFAAQSGTDGDQAHENSFDPEVAPPDSIMDTSAVSPGQQPPASNGVQPPGHRYSASSTTPNPKPSVGSEEWHKMRKDNHKEVERRRRETINEGINELAKIVPGCEKNKGSILQRAVSFISQLKENEQQNIEKWTLEKLLTEQAITELSASNDKLKQECERLYRELETWKRVAQNAGLEPPQPKEEPISSAPTS
ncbi:Helix-loop-helix protein that binds the motif CACRTG [Ophiocordyceps sinensis CO18]|uniref:Helix-loop-helix protein that binds the motif CACRTG n=1 Tax=Ophiocordyceps sinensis (strain Co18 / CGMCC 3.14243) TaxID=911162 RepID=T5ABC8_OPHSC|nr:Helix-loop-helix protein that binds the motif CACRTG [Ophiocordyceps sinensis CO18]